MWKIINKIINPLIIQMFFILPKKIKKEIDKRAKRGIDMKLPVRVDNNKLAKEKRLREIKE